MDAGRLWCDTSSAQSHDLGKRVIGSRDTLPQTCVPHSCDMTGSGLSYYCPIERTGAFAVDWKNNVRKWASGVEVAVFENLVPAVLHCLLFCRPKLDHGSPRVVLVEYGRMKQQLRRLVGGCADSAWRN